VEPIKRFSGNFNVGISPDLHAAIVTAAESEGVSLNQWVEKALAEEVR
jgi:predicted HicB family RNase H-like nuclease